MSIEQLARDIYAEFKAKPESKHIASEFALVELAKLVAEIKPKSVLEIGAGIGTITKLLLQHPNRPPKLTVTEAHPVCLRELQANLDGVSKEGYVLVQSATELNTAIAYDLVIFDGTLDNDLQYRVFKLGTWCFVEGSRLKTIAALQQKLNATGLSVAMRNVRPSGKKIKLKMVRGSLGLPFPSLKLQPKKGCSIGQITSL